MSSTLSPSKGHSSPDEYSLHSEINTPDGCKFDTEMVDPFSDESSIHDNSATQPIFKPENALRNPSNPARNLKKIDLSKKVTSQEAEWEDFMGKPPIPPAPQDITTRFEQYKQNSQKNMEFLAAEQQAREQEIHTFQPSGSGNSKRRSLGEFLREQERFSKQKQEKLSCLREEQEQCEESSLSTAYHPSLNENSLRIMQEKPRENSVFEKLYNSSKAPSALSSIAELDSSFTPSVNKKSRDLLRKESVDSLLYKDALRRQQKEAPKQLAPCINISSGSQKVLMEKLAKEFDAAYSEFENPKFPGLNYSLFSSFFSRLDFTKNDSAAQSYQEERRLVLKAWTLLTPTGEKFVGKQNLIVFVLCLMDLFPASLGTKDLSTDSTSMGHLAADEFVVCFEEAKRIHRHFLLLYQNKTVLKQASSRSSAPEYSFRPETLANSSALAEKYNQKKIQQFGTADRHALHKAEKQKKFEKLARIKQDREEADLRQCTFKPQINSYRTKRPVKEDADLDRNMRLYELSHVRREKQEKLEEFLEDFPRELSECTFAPKVNKNANLKTAPIVRGTDQAVQRMKKGREDKKHKDSMKLRNYSETPIFESVEDVESSEESEGEELPPLQDNFRPPSFPQKPQEIPRETPRETPKETPKEFNHSSSEEEELIINIKLPSGSQEQLVLRHTDDKTLKVQEFIMKHHLAGAKARKLQESILSSLI